MSRRLCRAAPAGGFADHLGDIPRNWHGDEEPDHRRDDHRVSGEHVHRQRGSDEDTREGRSDEGVDDTEEAHV
ncbi:MAG: hypothetical protein ABGW82_11730 [Paracoccus sp. (in: a-proteobacteria)]